MAKKPEALRQDQENESGRSKKRGNEILQN